MSANNYISSDPTIPTTGQYWDPAGEYEPRDTVYTLLVYVPPRPPPKWLPAFLCREPLDVSPFHIIRSKPYPPDYSTYWKRDLDEMTVKLVKVKSHRFPVALRCKHVQTETVCQHGCYVLEKGGDVSRFFCGREDCEGHVYCGNVKGHEGEVKEVKCFGKKGSRLVCFEGLPG